MPCHASEGLLGMGLRRMIAVVALASHSGNPRDVQTHIVKHGPAILQSLHRPLACAVMSFEICRAVCTGGFTLSLGLTTRAPVARSSPLVGASMIYRSLCHVCVIMISESCLEVRFWGLLALGSPHASKTCLLRGLLTCVSVCVCVPCTCMIIMATTSLD